jgi:hypothetical protein
MNFREADETKTPTLQSVGGRTDIFENAVFMNVARSSVKGTKQKKECD